MTLHGSGQSIFAGVYAKKCYELPALITDLCMSTYSAQEMKFEQDYFK
jgi:hypothetical protein